MIRMAWPWDLVLLENQSNNTNTLGKVHVASQITNQSRSVIYKCGWNRSRLGFTTSIPQQIATDSLFPDQDRPSLARTQRPAKSRLDPFSHARRLSLA